MREKERELLKVETNLNDSLIGGISYNHFNIDDEVSLSSKYLNSESEDSLNPKNSSLGLLNSESLLDNDNSDEK